MRSTIPAEIDTTWALAEVTSRPKCARTGPPGTATLRGSLVAGEKPRLDVIAAQV